jgi:enoyl-CoA hydratase/carnithine racemase
LVDDVLALAPLALEATKQSLRDIEAGVADEASLRAREHMTSQSADFAEGRAAFAQRRKPVFAGR